MTKEYNIDHSGNPEKASLISLGVFFLLGFTIILAVLGTLTRIVFAMTETGAGSISEGTAPLYLLLQGLVASFIVSFVFLFCFIILRRYATYTKISSFLQSILLSSIFFCVLIFAYLLLTRSMAFAMVVISHSVLLPILAVIAGGIIWPIRRIFGIKAI